MSDETQTQATEINHAGTSEDAALVMPDIEALEQKQKAERDESGRFVKRNATEDTADTAPADDKAEDAAAKGDDQKTDEPEADDAQMFIEIPPETEDGEAQRLDVEEVLAGYRRSQELEAELANVRDARPEPAPVDYDKAIMDYVSKGMQYARDLEQIQSYIAPMQPDESLINPHSDRYDPDAYFQQQQSFKTASEQFNALQSERQRVEQENAAHAKALMEARWDREQQKLNKLWPEIQDERTAEAVRDKLVERYGFDDETIDSVVDSRFYALAKDALAYRDQQSTEQKVVKAVKAKPKIIKTTARHKDTSNKDAQRQKLAKSGDIEDAVALMDDVL